MTATRDRGFGLPFFINAGLVALGSVVLAGWFGGIAELTRIGSSLSPMQPNTAVCFVLTGGALVLSRLRLLRLSFALSLGVLIFSSIVFAQHASGLDLGVDRLLFIDAVGEVGRVTPGRMAPNSAVAFILAGISAMLIGRRRYGSTTALSGCVVLTLGGSALLGFAVGANQAFGWGDLTQMSLLTALGLTALGASLVSEVLGQARRGDDWDATPRRAALLAGTTAALLSLLLWHTLRVQREEQLQLAAERAATGLQQEIVRRVEDTTGALSRLAAAATTADRRSLQEGSGAIGFAASEFVRIDWVDRRDGGWVILDSRGKPRAIEARQAETDLWQESLDALAATGSPVVSAPFSLVDGTSAVRVFVPVPPGRTAVSVSGLVSVDDLFAVAADGIAPEYSISVFTADRSIFEGHVAEAVSDSAITRELDLPGPQPWRIVVAPLPSLLSRQRSVLPELVMFGGLVIAVLLGSTVWFGGISSRQAERLRAAVRERTAELKQALDSLRSENEERRRSEQALAQTQHVSQMVAAERDLMTLVQAVTDAARELTGAAWGAFLYNLTDASGESFMLYSLSGIPREAFEGYPMPRNTELFGPTFRGEAPIRCADVRKDPRYGRNAPHRGVPDDHPLHVVSYLAVPVVSRSGSVWGGLLFGHPDAGVFGEDAEAVAVSLAAQTAIAMDNLSLLDAERHARDEAQAASLAKDRFLSVVSHELRNPLGSIRSALEVLEREPDDADAEARMRAILGRQVQQLARLVDDLLDVSRVVAGKFSIHVERIDLTQLVSRVVEAARTRVEGGSRRLELIAEDTPAWVDADPARITQALDNLIANAERYTEDRGAIRVRVVRDDTARRVNVVVEDDGRGIAKDEMPMLFEPFYQDRRGDQREAVGGGLGLGLAICKGVVEAHGGELSVSSAGPGRGAEFRIDLSLRTAPAAIPSPVESTPSAGKRVLVIDDHEDSLVPLAEMLRLQGHEVETALDGRSGIEAARRSPPHLVVCDLGMPDVDGYAVARALRADPATAAVRLIALSGYGDEAAVRKAAEAGFDRHMTKPVDPALLFDLLSEDLPA